MFFMLGYVADSFSFKLTMILVKLAVIRDQTGDDTGFYQNVFEITFSIHFYVNE